MNKRERILRARKAGKASRGVPRGDSARNNGALGGRRRDPAIDEFIAQYASKNNGKILSRRSASVLRSRLLKSATCVTGPPGDEEWELYTWLHNSMKTGRI